MLNKIEKYVFTDKGYVLFFSPLQIWYSLNFSSYSLLKFFKIFFLFRFSSSISCSITNQTLFHFLIISKCVGYTLILRNLNFKLLQFSPSFSYCPPPLLLVPPSLFPFPGIFLFIYFRLFPSVIQPLFFFNPRFIHPPSFLSFSSLFPFLFLSDAPNNHP